VDKSSLKNKSTNVRRPPGCHSDGPMKFHIAAVSAGTKKQLRIKNQELKIPSGGGFIILIVALKFMVANKKLKTINHKQKNPVQ